MKISIQHCNQIVISLALVLFCTAHAFAQNGGTLIDPSSTIISKHPSAVLEVSPLQSTGPDKFGGFLGPRLSLTGTGDNLTIASPADGLMVYNLATTGNVTPGYYYWNSGQWNRFVSGNGNFTLGSGVADQVTYWTGTNTISGSNNLTYDGTNIRLNGGKFGIGTAPLVALDINSTDAIQFPSGTTLQRPGTPVAGYTRYNTDIKAIEYYDGTQWVSANMTQVPIGTIAPYGGAVAPAGWIICNGAGVSTTTYADLFAVLGYTYGGSGATFNLPDLRGKAAFGWGSSAPFNTMGNSGGSTSQTPTISHSLAVDVASFNTTLPNHLHTVPGHSHGFSLATVTNNTGTVGDHAHNWGGWWSNDNASFVGSPYGDGSGNTYSDGYYGYWNQNFPTTTNGNHNHGMTTRQDDYNVSGGSGPSFGADNGNFLNYHYTANAGDHAHNVYMPNHRHWIQQRATSNGGSHNHSIPVLSIGGTVGSGSSGDAAFNSGNPTSNPNIAIDPPSTAITGTTTSSDIDITNPYQVTNYIIKATNTAAPSIVAVNIPTGTVGQTLYNNGSGWQATSNLYNGGTSVGIGSTAPVGALSIGTGNPFQVSAAGAISAATGITSSGTITLSSLNTNGLVRTTGTNGILSIGQAGTADIGNLAITNAKVNDVAWGKITGAPAFITGNQNITLTGDVTGSGATSIATTLANSGVGAGTYRSVTVDAKGRVTAGTNPTTLAGYGITDAAPISGSGSYIQNRNTSSQSANFWITGFGNVENEYRLDNTAVIYNSGTDVYGNIRVLQSLSTINDGMYLNYNSSGGASADLRLFANGTSERVRIKANTGNVGVGTTTPNATLDISSNGGSDGIAMGQIHGDNSSTIQTYIDGQWSNRATYASGCCNSLLLQPDVGTVGISTTAPAAQLHVYGKAQTAAIISAGTSYYTDWVAGWGGGLSSWDMCVASIRLTGTSSRSDKRLKKDINELESNMNAVETLQKLNPVTYHWIDERLPKNLRYGFIAQEIQEVLPNLVDMGTDSMQTLGVNYIDLIPILTRAIQEQQETIDGLNLTSSAKDKQFDELVHSNEALNARMKQLITRMDEMEQTIVQMRNDK